MADETTGTATATAETTATTTTETAAAETTATASTESLLTGKTGAEETKATEEQTSTDAKAAEEKGKEGPPEKYEFTAPEGITLDPAALEAFEPLAKELGLSQEAAQKVVNFEAARMKAQAEAWSKQQSDWIAEVKADKEIGGQNFATALRQANTALNKFGGEPLVAALQQLGIANHPELVRAFARVGKDMGEDTVHQPGSSPGGPRDLAKILYPNQP
jgi:hypothetical protein